MLSSFARESIIRLRYPERDDQGTPRPDYRATPAEQTFTGCWGEPIQSTENLDGRLQVVTGYTVVAPGHIDIVAADRIRYHGTVWRIDGDPSHVPSPTGILRSTRLILRREEG